MSYTDSLVAISQLDNGVPLPWWSKGVTYILFVVVICLLLRTWRGK